MVYFSNFIDFTKFFVILALLKTWCIPLMYPRHQIIESSTQYNVLQCFYLNSIVKKWVKWAENGILQQFHRFYHVFRYFSIIDNLVHTFDVLHASNQLLDYAVECFSVFQLKFHRQKAGKMGRKWYISILWIFSILANLVHNSTRPQILPKANQVAKGHIETVLMQ